MSQQHIELWKQAAQAFDQRHSMLDASQMQAATPCNGWCVEELVQHAMGTQTGMAAPLVNAEVAEGAEWPAVRDAMNAALEVEGALDGMTNHPAFGEVPKSMLLGIATGDLLLHSWDLARAIGADETLPAEAVQAVHMGLQQFPEEVMRGEGMFGPALEAPADADAQSQLLAFAGRQV